MTSAWNIAAAAAAALPGLSSVEELSKVNLEIT